MHIASGIKLHGRREILGFGLFKTEGESTNNGKKELQDLWQRGVRRVRTSIIDKLLSLRGGDLKNLPTGGATTVQAP